MIEITSEEAQKRLERSEPLPEIINGTSWKGNGSVISSERAPVKRLDDESRLLIGTLGQFQSHTRIAKEFGLNNARVHHLANGLIHSGDDKAAYKDPEFCKKLEEAKGGVAALALDKLIGSLGLITHDKLDKVPVKELTEITKDLSVVVRNVSGSGQEGKTNVAQVILFAPKTRSEETYDTMEVVAQVVR